MNVFLLPSKLKAVSDSEGKFIFPDVKDKEFEIIINNTGISGSYWSSTVSGDGSRYFNFSNGGAFVLTHNRVYGGSIRCIKN